MLPGNVMIVFGGFKISTSGTATDQGTSVMFFNATSMSWASNYTNPTYVTALHNGFNGSSSSSMKVGLGVGLAALVGAFLLYF